MRNIPYIVSNLDPAIQLYYEIHGDGKPLLLLHPLLGSHETWERLGYLNKLSKYYTVILIDELGHGKSSKPHEEKYYLPEFVVPLIVQLLNLLEISKVHIFGYSMGAWYAFWFYKFNPVYVEKLILGGMHPFRRTESDPRIPYFNQGWEGAKKLLQPKSLQRISYLRTQDYKAISTFLSAFSRYDGLIPGKQISFSIQCFIFFGEDDPMKSQILRFSELFTSYQIYEVKHSTHDLAFIRYNLIFPKLIDFLNDS